MTHTRPRRRRSDAADVVFRVGAALFAAWIYLRTLFVVANSYDPAAWYIFAWTGWPLVLIVCAGAVATLRAWFHGV